MVNIHKMRLKKIKRGLMSGELKMNNLRLPTTIDVNQIISWERNKELVEKPVYQRNKVWSESAKSYLIDSIMRNYPIPPIFMRDKLDLKNRTTIRELVDGQQRINAILEFYNNKFAIKKSQNLELGGKTFDNLTEEQQETFLTYKLVVEKITEKEDSLVFDMFARLNSNSIPLNRQELRNAKFTGEFKVSAYKIATMYREFFKTYNIFSDKKFSRMLDVEFISYLMMELKTGIIDETQQSLDKYYKDNELYEEQFEAYNYFENVLAQLYSIYSNLTPKNIFFSKVYFYDVFKIIANKNQNCKYLHSNKISAALNKLSNEISHLDKLSENDNLFISLNGFKDKHQRHSTNKSSKEFRIKFLEEWIETNG